MKTSAPLFVAALAFLAPLTAAPDPELPPGITELPATTPPDPATGTDLPLTLADAIGLTLELNQNIRLAREAISNARGQVRQSAGPFDPTLSAQLHASRQVERDKDSTHYPVLSRLIGQNVTDVTTYSQDQDDTAAQASVQTLFRNGVTVTPQATHSGDTDSSQGDSTGDATSTIGLTIQIPLLAGLGPNNQFAATERAAKLSVTVAEAQLEFTTSQAIYNTISAYWSLRLGQTNVRIARGQESASDRLVGITQSLIKGYVQPAVQLAQARANFEQYTAQRFQAELQQSMASQSLAVAIGFDPRQLLREPVASDDFPNPPQKNVLQPNDIPPLVEIAIELRPDIRAGLDTSVANQILLAGSRNAALPQLNLTFGGGYQRGSDTNDTRTTRTTDVSDGFLVTGAVSMELPFFNDAAEGAVMQQVSQLEQSRIQTSLTESNVASDVITSAKAVILTRQSLEEAIASARNEQLSVVAQEKLFAMGMSSLVEVITTQTNLSNSELSVASTKSNYATALAALRFATGTLTPDTATRPIRESDFHQLQAK